MPGELRPISRGSSLTGLLEPLRVFLDDPDVTEITTNEPGRVWALTRAGWTAHEMAALTAGFLKSVIVAISAFNETWSAPIMYVDMPGGERATIVQQPACIDGQVSVTLRKHLVVSKTIDELEAEGVFAKCRDVSFNRPSEDEVAEQCARADFGRLEGFEAELLRLKREGRIKDFLDAAVRYKRNIAISGKVGSGKTTAGRALVERVSAAERIVTIENVHELKISHQNKLHLLYGEGRGTAEEALRACTRLTPDRIFLAEISGPEAWEYFSSLNTGTPGSITTLHANSALDVPARVIGLVRLSEAGRSLPVEYVRQLLLSTLDVVLHFSERKLVEVFYDPIFAKAAMK